MRPNPVKCHILQNSKNLKFNNEMKNPLVVRLDMGVLSTYTIMIDGTDDMPLLPRNDRADLQNPLRDFFAQPLRGVHNMWAGLEPGSGPREPGLVPDPFQ